MVRPSVIKLSIICARSAQQKFGPIFSCQEALSFDFRELGHGKKIYCFSSKTFPTFEAGGRAGGFFKTNLVGKSPGNQRLECKREAVSSPNPMRYRPIWSCDFRYNFNSTRPTIIGSRPRVSQLRQVTGSLSLLPTNQPHGKTTLGSCRMELAR